MKIIQINSTCGVGSTGKICLSISKLLNEQSIENYIFYTLASSTYPQGRKYSSELYIKIQALKSRVFGNYGFNSTLATKKLISNLNEIKPDVVHIHNIHSHDLNLSLLFNYLKELHIRVIWTFHDCWAFTGYCTHFTMEKCDRWKTCCHNCPQRRQFSWFFDRSQQNFEMKKALFTGLDLTIVSPSQWLANLIKESFLKDYPVIVINNGIDLNIFKPTESNFREGYGLKGKYIVLGIAFGWGRGKGLDVFIDLAQRLNDRFQIVLVGTDGKIDRQLPNNIISIHRTQDQYELAKIYTAADVLANPTREENYPTVNMEAIACGTPVVTFRTGGSPETIKHCCGSIVDYNDNVRLYEEIICGSGKPDIGEILEEAKYFDKEICFNKYIYLYLHDTIKECHFDAD
mgnify:FL=1